MPLNNNYAAYGAGVVPSSRPPPQQQQQQRRQQQQQQHYNEPEHDFHDHADEYHEYHDHQEHAYDDGALDYMSDADIGNDLLGYHSEDSASPSLSFQHGRGELYSSGSEGGGEEAEGPNDDLFVPNYAPLEHSWVYDSEDEDENEQDQSEAPNPAPDCSVFLNPYESDHGSDDSDSTNSSRTASPASDSEGDSPTPSRSPSPLDSPQYDLESQAPSGSDLITISDSEAESSDFSRATASPPASASASASASVSSSSQGSPRPGPRGPHLRRSPYFDNIDRPSPRLSSLTPVHHPNRRLPRQPDDGAYDRYSAGNPDSSEDEPIIQRPQRRPLGIERTRRPVFSNPGLGISDEDEDDIEGHHANGWQSSEDDLPLSPRHRQGAYGRSPGLRRQDSSDEVSDQSDHSVQGSRRDYMLEDLPDYHFGEEGFDNRSEEERSSISSISDEEGLSDNLSQADESEGERQFVDLDNFNTSDEENDEEEAVRRRRLMGSREFAALQRRGLETRALIRQELALNERRGWAAPVDRVAPRPAENLLLDDSEPAGEDMDLEDELVEVVFDHMGQRHQQRQNNHRPNNQAGEVIDLTNEPDSPEQAHDRGFQNQRDAAPYRPPPRHAHRRGQHERGPAIIDLTNDDEEDLNFAPEVIDDDDDDGLFVRQHNHIPPNRRLPQPIPAPERHAHRNSVDRRLGLAMPVFGNIRRHIGRLGNLGEQIGNFYAAMPGLLYNDNMADRAMRDFHQAINPDPLANNAPDFNYQANGFAGRPPPPKPQFDEPPPARPGFTRNTGPDPVTGEEQKFICASCDNELMYYDNENDSERPAKRARYKKDREEHHFWAVKACGHVYCKNCYDDRRKVKALGQDYNMAFRVEPSASTKTAKIFCAVDDCQSDVTNNNAWVGIFM